MVKLEETCCLLGKSMLNNKVEKRRQWEMGAHETYSNHQAAKGTL